MVITLFAASDWPSNCGRKVVVRLSLTLASANCSDQNL
jgi:hypothetical protein